MPTQCERFVSALVGDRQGTVPRGHAEHVGQCLRCQLELARHRRLLRVLGELRDEEVSCPPSILTDVLDAIGRTAARSAARAARLRRRIRSGIGVAGAAVVLGGVVAIERSRPTRRRSAEAS